MTWPPRVPRITRRTSRSPEFAHQLAPAVAVVAPLRHPRSDPGAQLEGNPAASAARGGKPTTKLLELGAMWMFARRSGACVDCRCAQRTRDPTPGPSHGPGVAAEVRHSCCTATSGPIRVATGTIAMFRFCRASTGRSQFWCDPIDKAAPSGCLLACVTCSPFPPRGLALDISHFHSMIDAMSGGTRSGDSAQAACRSAAAISRVADRAVSGDGR